MLKSLAIDTSVSANVQSFLAEFYSIDSQSDWLLSLSNDAYQLSSKQLGLALRLDFREGNYRHRNNNTGKEPLLKAIKVKQKLPATLLDATPGVLKDSFMLAARGISIIAIERHPLVYTMIEQALSLVEVDINYQFGDASIGLNAVDAEVIYLDPMYPSKKKSAQVKKEMQVLHHIIGADTDAEQLLSAARAKNSRVVVKRPSYAEPLGGEIPSFVSQTGATRFDVYLPII